MLRLLATARIRARTAAKPPDCSRIGIDFSTTMAENDHNSELSLRRMPRGFKREALKNRYDVPYFREDPWHEYTGARTLEIVRQWLFERSSRLELVLNAGAGVYSLPDGPWTSISVDLFPTPLRDHRLPVCATVERLPFAGRTFDAVVCVGEVLAYCDPVVSIAEFGRILTSNGILICDFGSTRSLQRLFRSSFGRAADVVADEYNGSPEPVWIYDPRYIVSLMRSQGFSVKAMIGTHTWSALARRVGTRVSAALLIQHRLEWLGLPNRWADIMTIVAERSITGR